MEPIIRGGYPLANEKVIRDRAEGGSTTRNPSTATPTKRLRSGSYGCDTGRVAARGRACGNIASDHATRADHGIISDGHARQNDRTAADPHKYLGDSTRDGPPDFFRSRRIGKRS